MAPDLYQYRRLTINPPLALHSTDSYQMDHDVFERVDVVNRQLVDE